MPPAAAAQIEPPPSTAPPPTQPPTTAPPPPTTLPPNRATAITTGRGQFGQYSCALHQDGSVYCWGENGDGQLGNGTREGSLVPVQVLSITDATAITAGLFHTCALHRTGAISCWGSNPYGQLGNGTEAASVIPVQVTGITDATAITTGHYLHSCALHQTGTISCWGWNRDGELGNGQSGRNADSSIPVQVTGITDATAIAATGGHSCALHQDGSVSCWGLNNLGQLGNGQSGRNVRSPVPVQVTGITDATAITTGDGNSCALHQTGTISCWGWNRYGQLGNGQSGDAANSSVPVQVFGITDAIAITTGDNHSCALHRDGTISCWGWNYKGRLGNGQSGNDAVSIPVQVTGITDATAITSGYEHSCALHRDGTISCWGSNDNGELGDGTTRSSSVPVLVTGFGR